MSSILYILFYNTQTTTTTTTTINQPVVSNIVWDIRRGVGLLGGVEKASERYRSVTRCLDSILLLVLSLSPRAATRRRRRYGCRRCRNVDRLIDPPPTCMITPLFYLFIYIVNNNSSLHLYRYHVHFNHHNKCGRLH